MLTKAEKAEKAEKLGDAWRIVRDVARLLVGRDRSDLCVALHGLQSVEARLRAESRATGGD